MKAMTRIIIMFFLGLLIFLYAMFQGGFVSWFLLYSYIPVIVYSVYLYFYTYKDWEVTRNWEARQYFAGEAVTVQVTIKRKLLIPLLFVIIEDQLPSRLRSDAAHKQLFFLGWKRQLQFQYTIDELHRGVHDFRQLIVTTTDFLGIFKKSVPLSCPESITVLPKYFTLPFTSKEHSADGERLSGHADKAANSLLVSGVREFQAGDKRSIIDWKTTAKKQALMAKEFDNEKSEDIIIFMDCSKTQSDIAFERVISTAASLVCYIVSQRKSCQFICVGSLQIYEIVDRPDHFEQLLYMLAQVSKDSATPFSQALANELKKVPAPQHICIVTSEINSIQAFETIPASALQIFVENEELAGQQRHYIEYLREKGIDIFLNASRKE